MNLKPLTVSPGRVVLGGITLCLVLILGGCHKTPAQSDAPAVKAADDKDKAATAEEAEGVVLKPEEIEKMGIATTEAKSIMHAPEAAGFAVVLAHENIATALAELETAEATARQSRAALERTRRLMGTAGAMPADNLEGAERQAAVDQVALELAHRKLSSLFGQNSPWKNQVDSPQLRALANGDAKLVRVSFSLGATADAPVTSLRLAPINASQGGESFETRSVWAAPADATVPGRSYFGYLKTSNFAEGERLIAWVPIGKAESGVLVPAAAAVLNGGKFWCYVEEKPGQFVRTELDPASTTAEGYFVKQGIEPSAKIVTTAAGQLLAREINPSTAAAD